MPFMDKTLIATSDASDWTTAAFSGTIMLVQAEVRNLSVLPGRISVRYRKGSNSRYLLVPQAELSGSAGARFSLPATKRTNSDGIELFSTMPCSWTLSYIDAIGSRQATVCASSYGPSWTNVMTATAADTITGVVLANPSVFNAKASLRVQRGAEYITIINDEDVPFMDCRRKTPVMTLAVGDIVQVQSRGTIDWTFTRTIPQ